MKLKKIILISILVIFLSITSVSAFENTTLTSDETPELEMVSDYTYNTEKLETVHNADELNLSKESENTLKETPIVEIPTKLWDKGSYNMTISVPENSNGTLMLEGMINANYAINKTTIIPINNLEKGKYHLNVTYLENDYRHSQKFLIDVYDIDPYWYPSIEIPSEIGKFRGEEILYNEYPPLESNGTLTLFVDGIKMDFLKNLYDYGYLELNVGKLSIGNHTVCISFSGDKYFKPTNYTKSINITDVEFNDENILFYSEIDVLVPGDDEGTITLYKDGKIYSSKTITKKSRKYSDYQSYAIDVKIYNAKELKIAYSGKYGNITRQIDLPIYKKFYITAPDYYLIYGNEPRFEVNFPQDIEKPLEIYVDGTNYTISKPKGLLWKTIYLKDDISPGEHQIICSYPGDEKYSPITINKTIHIKPNFKIPIKIDYGCEDSIELKLPKDSEGNLTVYIKDDEYGEYKLYDSTAISEGNAIIILKNLDVGIYNIKCKFNGNYNVSITESILGINPIIIYPSQMTYGQNKYLTFKATPKSDSRIKLVKQNGKTFADVKLENGETKISLSKMDIVDYDQESNFGCGLMLYYYVDGKIIKTLVLDYHGDEYLESDRIPIKLTVNPIQPKLVGGKDITTYYNGGKSYTVTVYGVYGKVVGAGEIVNFQLGTQIYKIKTNKNGKASLKLTQIPKKYTLKVTYEKYWADVTVKNKITIKQILSLKKVKVRKTAKKLVLTATLKKGKTPLKGKKITFKFKGKKYTAKTNKKGIAKVTIKKSVLKKLKIGKKITYQATYIKDTVKKTVKVKR